MLPFSHSIISAAATTTSLTARLLSHLPVSMVVLSLALNAVLVQTFAVFRYCSGFDDKTASVDEFQWSYIERKAQGVSTKSIDTNATTTTSSSSMGKGNDSGGNEPVVFLHGFGARKESWLRVASGLDKRHRILVPDLPGQGATLPADPTLSYTMDEQARRLHQFLLETAPEADKVHVVGCSMGGMLAGMYAAMYPEHVRSLTVMCPAGITMPNKSVVYRNLEETGRNLLLAHTADDLMEMLSYTSHQPSKMPRWAASLFADLRKRELPVLTKIAGDALTNPTILEDNLHRITAPTLVMWGKNDRILDVSSLPILEEKLRNAPQKHVLVAEDCGHIIQHERHAACTSAINAFLDHKEPILS